MNTEVKRLLRLSPNGIYRLEDFGGLNRPDLTSPDRQDLLEVEQDPTVFSLRLEMPMRTCRLITSSLSHSWYEGNDMSIGIPNDERLHLSRIVGYTNPEFVDLSNERLDIYLEIDVDLLWPDCS